MPWLPASTPEPFHYQCPVPVVSVPCSHPHPSLATWPRLVPCLDLVVPSPPQQPTTRAVAAAPTHCRHHRSRVPVVTPLSLPCTRAPVIRALVHPVRAQYTATPSCALSTLSPVLPVKPRPQTWSVLVVVLSLGQG